MSILVAERPHVGGYRVIPEFLDRRKMRSLQAGESRKGPVQSRAFSFPKHRPGFDAGAWCG